MPVGGGRQERTVPRVGLEDLLQRGDLLLHLRDLGDVAVVATQGSLGVLPAELLGLDLRLGLLEHLLRGQVPGLAVILIAGQVDVSLGSGLVAELAVGLAGGLARGGS